MPETLNIAFDKGNSLDAQILSNVALTPFKIDEVIWASVEAFWKALYHPEHDRPIFREEFGISAWIIFRNREYPTSIVYNKKRVKVGSKSHYKLMERALREKIQQNSNVQDALIRTRNLVYQHITTEHNDSPNISGEQVAHILNRLRDEWIDKNYQYS